VTTVDIDLDVVAWARQRLTRAGYPQVRVEHADAETGVANYAPYDRIIVTVGTADIPPAWVDQLALDGIIVAPVRLRGLNHSIAFTRRDHTSSGIYHPTRPFLVGCDHALCGFVSMQGAGALDETLVMLDGEDVALRVDGLHDFNARKLSASLKSPRAELGTGVFVGATEAIDEADLWTAIQADRFCLLVASNDAIARGVVPRAARLGAKTIVDGASFAYRASGRPVGEDGTRFELMVHAHGPDADRLADQYAALLRVWDQDRRGGSGPRFEVHPAGTPDSFLPAGRVIDRPHTRLVMSWP
jgi:protein-L-isoaspartate(D-aspartate) O-methyltransferase